MNTYQLADYGQTTIWNPDQDDVNGRNGFGNSPFQVALMAGNLEELILISHDARFDIAHIGQLAPCWRVLWTLDKQKCALVHQWFNQHFINRYEFDGEHWKARLDGP